MENKSNDFYYSISMKNKWILFICVVIIYPIVLIGYFGYKNYEKMIGDYFIESVQKDVSIATEQVEEHLKSLEDFVKKLQYDEYIYSFIQEREYSSKPKGNKQNIMPYISIPDYEFKRATEKHLNSILLSRPEFTLASIQFKIDPGSIYTVTRKKSYAEELKFAETDIYQWELTQKEGTLYYIDAQKDLYIIQKIISRRNFEHSATVTFKIDSKLILQKLENMLEGAKKGVYVIGLDNKEMLQAGEVSAKYKKRISSYFKESESPGLYPGENPKKEFIVYDTISAKNHEIGVAVLIFTDILLKDIRTLSSRIILLSLSTIPIFLLLAYKLYKDMIQPIYELSSKMREIEKGEIGVLVDSDRKDEIGILFRSFNKMSNRIQYLVNRVYKEQLALKNSEIRALQAQINPHFLYNTLEIINWKARLSGADDVAEMIEALGGIMEINIDRKDERFLTVEEELKYTNHYIFLIKKRFGDKIKFKQYITQEVMWHKVPRLILQPIIENAIEHGIEPVGRGMVTLRIYVEDELLIIEVEDSGQGIEEEVISKLQLDLQNWKSLASERVEATSHGKIGVLNVHSRLRLIYGNQSGIEITSRYNKGTLIRMNVPVSLTEQFK